MDKRDFLFRFVAPEIRIQLRFDEEAFFSTTDQLTADRISKSLLTFIPRTSLVVDATACVGGNTYSFAQHFARVRAFELDPRRAEMLAHNLRILGVSHNTRVMCGDAAQLCRREGPCDLVFVDPPWGGPEYKNQEEVDLFLADRVPLEVFCREVAPYTSYISIKVPKNFACDRFVMATCGYLELLDVNTHLRKMNLVTFACRKGFG